MRPLFVQRRARTMLVAIWLLILQIGGAHVHLCLDGQGPAVQVRLADVAPATAHGLTDAVAPHVDEDVPLRTTASARAESQQLDAPPLAPAFAYLKVRPPRFVGVASTHHRSVPLPLVRHFLQPPLRGPPLTARA